MRKAALVFMVLVCAVLLASGGSARSAPNAPAVSFVTIASGRTSGILQPAQSVIRDRESWLALWRRHAGPAAPAPAVDFSREMAIAIFAGASAAPRIVTIARIVREPERLTVWYVVRERPLTDTEGLKPTAAFHIVRLARSPLPVSFSAVKSFPVVPQP